MESSIINASELLSALRFIVEQAAHVDECRRRNLVFSLHSQSIGRTLKVLLSAARAWSMPQLSHVILEVEDAHNVYCVGGLSIHSAEAVRYQRSLENLKVVLEKGLSDKYIVLGSSNLGLSEFGDIEKKLPAIVADVSAAIRCLELQCSTASVFHMMRALEATLRAVGKRLRIEIEPSKENWYQIVQHVNKAVDALPSKTRTQAAKKQQYGALSAHLNAVRISWRNEVMHPNASYSAEEAAEVLAHSKVLIRHVTRMI
ncbi:hypothetical protein ABIC65_003362 [Sphingomonas trueperi]|uniref:hypothetical protein n=1 Tax=Sphingomonas trueperi TaxID=53317 RepID=UPI00339AC84F